MAWRSIYVDTDSNDVVTSPTDNTPAPLPPMVQGDVLSLRIYLLSRNGGQFGPAPYSIINNSGLTLRAGIGPKDGTTGSALYTSQFSWTPDTLNQYFAGDFPLNTTGIGTAIGPNESADLWFELELTNSTGFPWTVLQKKVSVQAEVIESAAVEVPVGQVALTLADARSQFLARAHLKAIYLEDINNDGQYIVLFNENGTLVSTPVTGTPIF